MHTQVEAFLMIFYLSSYMEKIREPRPSLAAQDYIHLLPNKSNTNMTLLILAAGIGSRYGGNKQIESLGKNKAWLIDYALFDALEVGFSRAVLVIREEIREALEAHLLPRWSKSLRIEFVLQSNPNQRHKPWGTAQATLSAAEQIQSPFALINADDFYGRDAFESLYGFLGACDARQSHWAMVPYPLQETLSAAGSVSRGLCQLNSTGFLEGITEETHIVSTPQGPRSKKGLLPKQSPVSMNCWAFTPTLFKALKESWSHFYATKQENLTAECFLPTVVGKCIEDQQAKVQVLRAAKQWIGVTYPEEKATVTEALAQLHQNGSYPDHLEASSGSSSIS